MFQRALKLTISTKEEIDLVLRYLEEKQLQKLQRFRFNSHKPLKPSSRCEKNKELKNQSATIVSEEHQSQSIENISVTDHEFLNFSLRTRKKKELKKQFATIVSDTRFNSDLYWIKQLQALYSDPKNNGLPMNIAIEQLVNREISSLFQIRERLLSNIEDINPEYGLLLKKLADQSILINKLVKEKANKKILSEEIAKKKEIIKKLNIQYAALKESLKNPSNESLKNSLLIKFIEDHKNIHNRLQDLLTTDLSAELYKLIVDINEPESTNNNTVTHEQKQDLKFGIN